MDFLYLFKVKSNDLRILCSDFIGIKILGVRNFFISNYAKLAKKQKNKIKHHEVE